MQYIHSLPSLIPFLPCTQASNRHSQLIDGHLRSLDAVVLRLQGTERDSEAALDTLRSAITRTSEGIKTVLEQWAAIMSRECSALFEELAVQQEKHVGEVSSNANPGYHICALTPQILMTFLHRRTRRYKRPVRYSKQQLPSRKTMSKET